MIQAIFFDVDGTLVSFRTHTIPASTWRPSTPARQGDQAVLATGRHQAMLRPFRSSSPLTAASPSADSTATLGPGAPQQPHAAGGGGGAGGRRGGEHLLLHFSGGEDIYLNCVNDLTRQFIQDLYIPMPPVRPPATLWAGRSIRQSPSSAGNRSTCCWTGPPTSRPPAGTPIFRTSSRPPEERIWEWMPFWTTSASRWKTAWPLATEKTTCPC